MNTDTTTIAFRFIEYNPRRAVRGAEAARVAILEDGENVGWVWMSREDIRANIAEFGPSAELTKALEAYRR